MPAFAPLSNLGTSQVFYEILEGRKNPKAIADSLGVQPPPVIQQLRRLRKINVVELGKKVGRVQNYEINWGNFLAMFIDRAIQERARKLKERIREGDILITHDYELKNKNQIRTLKDNKYFKRLVHLYLQNVAESKGSNRNTISGAISNFENALQTSVSFKRSKKFEDSEKQDFFDKMRLWYDRTTRAETWMDLNLHDAIYKILKE